MLIVLISRRDVWRQQGEKKFTRGRKQQSLLRI